MPITKSAKKELRKNIKRRLLNLKRKQQIKFVIKKFKEALEKKDKENAQRYLSLAYKHLDKTAKRFLHKNKASRLKSRLVKKFNTIFQ